MRTIAELNAAAQALEQARVAFNAAATAARDAGLTVTVGLQYATPPGAAAGTSIADVTATAVLPFPLPVE